MQYSAMVREHALLLLLNVVMMPYVIMSCPRSEQWVNLTQTTTLALQGQNRKVGTDSAAGYVNITFPLNLANELYVDW